MSGLGRRVDVRIAHTVAYLLQCPRSLVPEAMRACKFTLDESENRSKQMTIRRSLAAQKATGGKLVPPPDVIDTVTAATTTVSPLTDTETSWDCTFGLNTKGGMDDCEFEQYVMNSILPLYPKTRDRPGHRLLLKCDSGPGRLQISGEGGGDRRENEIEEVSAADV